MSDYDLDLELRRALRSSPEEASANFTQQVLAHREDRPRNRRWAPRPALATAAVLLFVIGGAAGLMVTRQTVTHPMGDLESDLEQASQKEQLLDEYRALERELEQLRRLASEQTPVLYLGGDEDFDLMYDLADYQAGRSQESIRPASLPDRG